MSQLGTKQGRISGIGIAEVTTGVQPWGLLAHGAHRAMRHSPDFIPPPPPQPYVFSLVSHRSLTLETRWCTRPSTPSSTAWAASPTPPRTCGSGPSASPTHVSVFLSDRELWLSPSLGTLSGGALKRVKITKKFLGLFRLQSPERMMSRWEKQRFRQVSDAQRSHSGRGKPECKGHSRGGVAHSAAPQNKPDAVSLPCPQSCRRCFGPW